MINSIKNSKVAQAAIACRDLLSSLFNEGAFPDDFIMQDLVRGRLEAYDNAEDDPSELNEDDYVAKLSRIDQRIRMIIRENLGVEAPGYKLDEALDCLEDECRWAKIKLRKAAGQ